MDKNQEISILYVDDEEPNLFLFKMAFEDKYDVITANSGQQGLVELEHAHNKIIVVISDMRMPEMNGIQFISQSKKLYSNIGYFILTGFDYNDEIDKALKSNVIHKFFTKPFKQEEIEAAIEEFRGSLLVE